MFYWPSILTVHVSGIWYFWNSVDFFDQLMRILIKQKQKQEKLKS